MKFYIGIDGGASSTRGVLINSNGETLSKILINEGTNLKVYGELACVRIRELITDLCKKSNLSVDDISSFGIGLAAVSYDMGRDFLFKELDRINISDKAILLNDAEAAYKVLCQDDVGILVTVGTGVICMAKNSDGKVLRVAGKGHDKSDIGSGYWIGNATFLKLIANEGIVDEDSDLLEIRNIIYERFEDDNFNDILSHIANHANSLSLKASIAKDIISISDKNEVALKILQEATYNVADYIINLIDLLDYAHNDELVLFGNGSVIKSSKYRKLLNESLSFHYSKINWIFSDISAAYGSAIFSAYSKDKILIQLADILKGDYLVSG